tara:strand:+ start:3407 stop:3811 length:405 start_codon:yes stop_codon:yes gene_type:complete
MATNKDYAYYIEGNEIAVVEKDVSFDNDVTSKEYGPGASRANWGSPKSTVANGLEIKYVQSGTKHLQDESSELNLPPYIAKALVYYVKAKFAEDAGELKLKMYFDKEFKKMLEKHETAKISGIRIMSPGPHSMR